MTTHIRCIQIGNSIAQGEPVAVNTGEPFRNPIPNYFAGRLVTVRDENTTYIGTLVPSLRKPKWLPDTA